MALAMAMAFVIGAGAASSASADKRSAASAPSPARPLTGPWVSADGRASTFGLLSWRPPTCGDATHTCEDLYLTNTGAHRYPSLSAGVDYRLHLPASEPLVGGLSIDGGHNVTIIGGEIELTTPCVTDGTPCHGINISRAGAGQVYIEGVLIKNPDPTHSMNTGDGIDVDDYPGATDVVLQNVRIEGIDGCDPGNPSTHADVFQPYNAGGAKILVDHLTGTTDCQGMQLDPGYAWEHYGTTPAAADFRNVNINVLPNPHLGNSNRYAWWFTHGTSGCVSYPIELTNVYTQEPDGTLRLNSVWPDTNQPAGCTAIYRDSAATWPTLPTLTGWITSGLPPGGDFVPAGTAGIKYTSLGYQDDGVITSLLLSEGASSA
jgi:hypothetical protein